MRRSINTTVFPNTNTILSLAAVIGKGSGRIKWPCRLICFVFLITACQNASEQNGQAQEATEKVVTHQLDIKVTELPERHYLVLRQRLPLDNMTGFFGIESAALVDAARKAGVKASGPISGLFYEWNEAEGIGDAAVALPVAAGTELPPYVLVNLPAQRAFAAELNGPYPGLGAIHFGLSAQFETQNVQPGLPIIEEYLVGPTDNAQEDDFRTRVLHPIIE